MKAATTNVQLNVRTTYNARLITLDNAAKSLQSTRGGLLLGVSKIETTIV